MAQKKKKKSGKLAPMPAPKVGQPANLKRLAAKYKKDFDIGPINVGGKALPIEYVSTGFQTIDDAFSGTRESATEPTKPGSGKGLPRGRIIEIYGPEAAAKTSLALAVIAQAQRMGEPCAYIDVEHALDPFYATKAMGVDLNESKLLHYEPEDAEKALGLVEACVKDGVSVVVLDSVAALSTQEELKGGKALGQQARLMSQTCRKLTTQLKSGGPMVIFVNQIRYKIGVVFGNPEFTSGGNALKFYSSIRAEVRKKQELKRPGPTKNDPITAGLRIRLRVIKNKVAPAYGTALFDVMLGEGIRVPTFKKKKQKGD